MVLQILGRLLAILVAIGVVLAGWRYLGQGVGIGSPGWLNNAFDSVLAFFSWSDGVATKIRDATPTIEIPVTIPDGFVGQSGN